MSYLENILVCIGVPFLLALLFVKGKQKEYLGFILCGMCCCLLAAYVTSFFMAIYGADALVTSVEITPVCEEILKFLPFLLWLLIFEPQQEEILSAAMFIAIGFATFEKPPPGSPQIRYFPFWIAFRSSQQRIHMKEICLIICRQRTL